MNFSIISAIKYAYSQNECTDMIPWKKRELATSVPRFAIGAKLEKNYALTLSKSFNRNECGVGCLVLALIFFINYWRKRVKQNTNQNCWPIFAPKRLIHACRTTITDNPLPFTRRTWTLNPKWNAKSMSKTLYAAVRRFQFNWKKIFRIFMNWIETVHRLGRHFH